MTKFLNCLKINIGSKKRISSIYSEDLIKLDHEKKLYDVVGIQ